MVKLNFDHFYKIDGGARVKAMSERMKEASLQRRSRLIIHLAEPAAPRP